jgi:hypothetical protein
LCGRNNTARGHPKFLELRKQRVLFCKFAYMLFPRNRPFVYAMSEFRIGRNNTVSDFAYSDEAYCRESWLARIQRHVDNL